VLLLHAARQQVPVEYYKAAYLSAANLSNGSRSADYQGNTLRARLLKQSLESAITSLFPGNTRISIYVKSLNMSTVPLDVWDDTKISTLISIICCKQGSRGGYGLVLMYNMRILRDHQTIRDYGIKSESTLHILPRARWIGPKYMSHRIGGMLAESTKHSMLLDNRRLRRYNGG
jgi:hypothetical protein